VSDQQRLLERADTDSFKRMLLRSADFDRPAPQVRTRARAALAGLAAGAVALGSGQAALAGTSTLGGIGAAALLKSLGIGFLVGVGVMGSVSLSVGEPAPPRQSTAPAFTVERRPGSESRTEVPSAPAANTAVPATQAARSAVAALHPAPRALVRGQPIASAIKVASDSEAAQEQLAAELTALDQARQAVAAGRPGDALAQLDQMGNQFRQPSLAQETAVVRIEALANSGAHDLAAEQARSFLSAHPRSPYAGRVRRILAP
jgi:hypothetical protein